ncbi:hypothetical protein Tco_0811010 [Tanacetum coccineum]
MLQMLNHSRAQSNQGLEVPKTHKSIGGSCAPDTKEDTTKFPKNHPPSWNQIALIMRNKPDIDEIDIDDLYNNLRVYEDEMKRSSSSTPTSQNLAFLSSENTSSSNEVSTASRDFRPHTSPHLRIGFSADLIGDDMENGISMQVQVMTVKEVQKSFRGQEGHDSRKNEHVSLENQKLKSSDEESTPVNDMLSKADKYHAVPPPITGNFLTPRANISFAGKTNEANIQKPKTVYEPVNRDKVIIEDWNSDDEDDVSEVQTGNPEILLQDHAVVDSGCSSHMTGNKAYLSDYKAYLYGLHQASRAWYGTLSSFLMENGFKRDLKTVCTKISKSPCELTFFLGLQVKQQPDGIFISQDKYVADILKKIDFFSIKIATTPIKSNKTLVKDEDDVDVDVHVYRFQVTPKASHLNAVKRIFRYLKHQPKLGLWYPRDSPFELEAYSDSDYGGASLDRKSTTGGCQFLGRRLISWQCKKQTIMANSTTEAEYVAAANCCGQVLWIQNQMMDYGFNFMNTKIHIDNESTISVIKNPVAHSRTKHIEIRFHFIRDCYEKRLIEVIKIHTDHNVADLLTKGFDVIRFNFLVVSIGLPNL